MGAAGWLVQFNNVIIIDQSLTYLVLRQIVVVVERDKLGRLDSLYRLPWRIELSSRDWTNNINATGLDYLQHPKGMAMLKSKHARAFDVQPRPRPRSRTWYSPIIRIGILNICRVSKTILLPPLMLTIRKKLAEQQASKATGGSSGDGSPSGSNLKRKVSFRSQLLTAGMFFFFYLT